MKAFDPGSFFGSSENRRDRRHRPPPPYWRPQPYAYGRPPIPQPQATRAYQPQPSQQGNPAGLSAHRFRPGTQADAFSGTAPNLATKQEPAEPSSTAIPQSKPYIPEGSDQPVMYQGKPAIFRPMGLGENTP
jgi:hypothetical protein